MVNVWRTLPPEYRLREPTLAPWVDLGFEPSIVRSVLLLVARAFRWNETDALRLRPEDEVWPIYRHYYPQTHWWQRWIPDELEMETLLRDVEQLAPRGRTIDLHPYVTVADLVRSVAP